MIDLDPAAAIVRIQDMTEELRAMREAALDRYFTDRRRPLIVDVLSRAIIDLAAAEAALGSDV
jgi:hypothetical protein